MAADRVRPAVPAPVAADCGPPGALADPLGSARSAPAPAPPPTSAPAAQPGAGVGAADRRPSAEFRIASTDSGWPMSRGSVVSLATASLWEARWSAPFRLDPCALRQRASGSRGRTRCAVRRRIRASGISTFRQNLVELGAIGCFGRAHLRVSVARGGAQSPGHKPNAVSAVQKFLVAFSVAPADRFVHQLFSATRAEARGGKSGGAWTGKHRQFWEPVVLVRTLLISWNAGKLSLDEDVTALALACGWDAALDWRWDPVSGYWRRCSDRRRAGRRLR